MFHKVYVPRDGATYRVTFKGRLGMVVELARLNGGPGSRAVYRCRLDTPRAQQLAADARELERDQIELDRLFS